MCEKCKDYKKQIKELNDILHHKNLLLDSLGYVWCSGGCDKGIFRYSENTLTEEQLLLVERNTKRLRQWYNNKIFKERNKNES